jgi:hypothetical protein
MVDISIDSEGYQAKLLGGPVLNQFNKHIFKHDNDEETGTKPVFEDHLKKVRKMIMKSLLILLTSNIYFLIKLPNISAVKAALTNIDDEVIGNNSRRIKNIYQHM